jgi:hypothetical protein
VNVTRAIGRRKDFDDQVWREREEEHALSRGRQSVGADKGNVWCPHRVGMAGQDEASLLAKD